MEQPHSKSNGNNSHQAQNHLNHARVRDFIAVQQIGNPNQRKQKYIAAETGKNDRNRQQYDGKGKI